MKFSRLFVLVALLVGLLAACSTETVKPELSDAEVASDVLLESVALTSGSLPNLSGATGSSSSYEIVVPAGATDLTIATSGGTGDVDLYVRAGSAATSSSYDCRPFESGNNETCTFANPQATTYYILLRAYKAYSGVTLSTSYDAPDAPTPPAGSGTLTKGVPATGLSAVKGGTVVYTIDVPEGATDFSVTSAGGTGDADLYVRRGSEPTTSVDDCRSYTSGSSESCTIAAPQAGTYYILLKAYAAFSGVSLEADYTTEVVEPPTGDDTLTKGVATTGLSAAKSEQVVFTINVPTGATNLIVTSSGGTGDADLYVRRGSEPTTSVYDCRSYTNGNGESCTIAAPQAGTYYILLKAYAAFSGVSLVADYAGAVVNPPTDGNTLVKGVAKTGLSAARNEQVVFTIDLPAGAANFEVTSTGGSGDADLYVRRGSKPTTSVYDCRSYTNGNSESCTIVAPQAGTYYVVLRAYSAFASVSLVVDYQVGTGGGPSGGELLNGVQATNINAPADGNVDYFFTAPAGAFDIVITAKGGTGSPNLIVRVDEEPTASTYDCRRYKAGSEATCEFGFAEEETTYYVRLAANQGFSGLTLVAEYTVDNSFDIEFIFSSTVTSAQKQLFQQAGQRWESVITGGLPDREFEKPFGVCGQNEPAFNDIIDDLIIYVNVGPRDGEGGLLASAGPCAKRSVNAGQLPIYGVMNFDSADSKGPELYETILHEMGHVIGIGTLWTAKNVVDYSGCPSNPRFTAANAVREWQAFGGLGSVPVEQDGGPGTACGHWDEETFDTELMTGYSEGAASEPMSRMTIGSLQDLGYEVNYAQAEAYVLPIVGANLAIQSIDFDRGEELIFPLGTTGADGIFSPLTGQ